MLASNFLTATETQGLLSSGKLTLDKVLRDHVTRRSERDGAVRAWAYYQGDAAKLDHGDKGSLRGVVLGIKDIIITKDMPTGHGSEICDGSHARVDASVVGVCRSQGAIMLGKTHTTAFAASKIGPPTCNPFHPGHTPGGSSSGSAAAVADYQCHIALGTQTGGSIIRPASFCGVFGFKPTHGTICRDGVKSFAQTFDTIGFFARSISDIQLISRACRVFDDRYKAATADTKSIQECRLAFVKTDQFEEHATEDLRAVWAKARHLLVAAGATVKDVDLPTEFHGLSAADGLMPRLTAIEARSNLLYEYTQGKDKLDPELAGFVEDKPVVTSRREIADVVDQLASLRPKIDAIAREYDAIVTPSVPGEAPEGLGWTGDPRFCTPWTGLHTPSINIPGFAGSKGLPIGLTLVASRYDDERLLQVAKLVAEVFIGSDEGKLGKIPAPEGAVHVQP